MNWPDDFINKVIQGDCLGVMRRLPDKCVDLVITDPPYGVSYDGGAMTPREGLAGDGTADLYAPALAEMVRVAKDDCAFYIFYADGDIDVLSAATSAGLTIRNNLIWNKNMAQFGALSAQYKNKHEPFLYCHKKGKAPHWYGPTNETTVWDCKRSGTNEFHPTQKPVDLIRRAIMNSSEEGMVVLDPFLGGGTTAVAAKLTNRQFIGIELNPSYCETARARLRQDTLL